jgi:hypothetical protein
MTPSIDIDDELFDVLKHEAEAFVDTPNSVLRRLLGIDTNGHKPAETPQASTPAEPNKRTPGKKSTKSAKAGKRKRAPRGSLLPESEYEIPILRYLADHGGRAPSREVVESLDSVMGDRLTEADKQPLNSGEIRWKSRAAFVRLRLVEAGDLDGDAPRGTWQITDQGRARLRDEA